MPLAHGIGRPMDENEAGTRCGHTDSVDGYGPRCPQDAVYHLMVEDTQDYGWGLVSTHACADHLPEVVQAGRLLSAHLAAETCFGSRTINELIITGCIPVHLLPEARHQ
jgi:hypothetical protein